MIICMNPCEANNEYLYPVSTCQSDCLYPLNSKEGPLVKYCLTSCSETDFIFSLSNSCIPNCPPPLIKEPHLGIMHYKNPCQPDEYLYPDSSCHATCHDPLVETIDPDDQYCRGNCSSGEYFFKANLTCLLSCPFPLESQIIFGIHYCENPCSNSLDYLYPDVLALIIVQFL